MDQPLLKPIHDVLVTDKKIITDDRGAIQHMLRNDDPEFKQFGEIYFSKVLQNIIKGWHLHRSMTLNYYLVYGSVKLVLFDNRSESITYNCYQELLLSADNPQLITIPPNLWNAFQGLTNPASLIANCATEPHHPDEIIRKPIDDRMFAYKW